MNLASIFIKKILVDSDIDAWSSLRKHYLPKAFHQVYETIEKHLREYGKLPTFTELELSVRHPILKAKIESINSVEYIDIDCGQLLDYVKNEFVQVEALSKIDKFLDSTIATGSAEEIIEALRAMIIEIESQVDFVNPEDDMRRIELFDSEEILSHSLALGLNDEYDRENLFAPTDYVLLGGRRGGGKSLTCANIVSQAYKEGKSSVYFTIEMPTRQILHRVCSINTEVPASLIRKRDLTLEQWKRVAEWWAGRFEGGYEDYNEYLNHRDFDKLHSTLITKPLRKTQIEIIYDATLTLGRIRAELDKLCYNLQPAVVVVDYINKVKTGLHNNKNQFDWTEQMTISENLKILAQEYNVLMVSPYQIDSTGEARMAKGILDPADIAFTLDSHKKDDNAMSFNCVKRRNGPEISFTSVIDWSTLKIGPESAVLEGMDESDDGETASEL